MTRTKRRWVVFVAVPALAAMAMVALALWGDQGTKPDVESLWNGSISVGGRVVDQDGEPLLGVTMSVREVTFTNGETLAEFYRLKKTSQVVDGTFDVSCQTCSSVQLGFSKPGYYEVSYTCGVTGGRESSKEALCKGLEIVLDWVPPAVQVAHEGGELLFDLGGPREVVALGPGPRGSVTLSPQKTMASLGSSFVYLIVGTEPDGEISRSTAPIPGRKGMTHTVPTGARLIFSDPTDGLVLYEPRTKSPSTSDVFREMREAPETGYANALDFDELPNDRDVFYFYCRIGGRYGKGGVGAPRFSSINDLTKVRSAVTIELNPAGSRNVTTHY